MSSVIRRSATIAAPMAFVVRLGELPGGDVGNSDEPLVGSLEVGRRRDVA